jgi:hypothetical protein
LRKVEYPAAIRELIAQLRHMPGVGPALCGTHRALDGAGAQRSAGRDRAAISTTRQTVRPCTQCGFFTMQELCEICADPTRVADQLCVVEQPTDILPLEKTSAFRGRYHALGGRISPLDHVGPETCASASWRLAWSGKVSQNHPGARCRRGRRGDYELPPRTAQATRRRDHANRHGLPSAEAWNQLMN